MKLDAFTDWESMTYGVTVESVTKGAKDHAAQLREELLKVPEVGNPVTAREIRDYLRTMEPAELDLFLDRCDDLETVSAVMQGPKILALGSERARAAMLRNYNAKHRARQTATAAVWVRSPPPALKKSRERSGLRSWFVCAIAADRGTPFCALRSLVNAHL